MANQAKPSDDSEVNREIQRFSMRALTLAKAVVDGSATDADRKAAHDLSEQIRSLADKAGTLDEAYRADAMRALADARLDLAFAAANGGVPSSTRLGWYIKEHAASG